MVRLRSERWYSADGQRRSRNRVSSQTVGTRRLLSMCFLLALVILLMQKAAEPRYVSNAFRALGVPLEQAIPEKASLEQASLEQAEPETNPAELRSEPASRWEATCQDLVPRLLAGSSDTQLIELSSLWFAVEPRTPVDDLPSTLNEVRLETARRLQEIVEQTQAAVLPETETEAWLISLKTFQDEWQLLWRELSGKANDLANDAPLPPMPMPSVSPELASSLTIYLDQRLVQALRDGSPWSTSETTPFWRLLQRGQGVGRVGIERMQGQATWPLVNTLQLESETELYRGRVVRFRGSVRRVERVRRNYPSLGFKEGYYLMWLRGEDDAVQPIAVYSSDVSAHRLAQILENESADYPAIEVQAIFAKRLAYASPSGVQVAPTLFALSIERLMPARPTSAIVQTDDMWWQMRMAMLAGVLLAAVLVTPILLKRRGQSKRQLLRRPFVPKLWLVSGWLAGWATCAGGVLSQASWAQEIANPPWAQITAEDSVRTLLVQRVDQIFSDSAATELREYARGVRPAIADSSLKILNLLNKVGWRRALELQQQIPLKGGLSLRPVSLSGFVRMAMPVALTDGQRAWFQGEEGEQLFRVELQVEISPSDRQLSSAETARSESTNTENETNRFAMIPILCRQVPAAWLNTARLRQPATAQALGVFDEEVSDLPLCLFADRLAWLLPPDTDPLALEPSLEPTMLELGRSGWDLSFFEQVANRNQQSLGSEESNAFFSMLRIANSPNLHSTASRRNFDNPLEVLADPQSSVGKQVRWRVRLVSATLVQVSNPQLAQVLGADRYVQYDGFADIGEQRVNYQTGDAKSGLENLEFAGEFPVTIVMSGSSSFIPEDALEVGQTNWEIGKYAVLDGRFYRLWSYHSERLTAQGKSTRQVAPLVIGARLTETVPPIRPSHAYVGWFGYALCGAILVFLGAVLLLTAKTSRLKRRS